MKTAVLVLVTLALAGCGGSGSDSSSGDNNTTTAAPAARTVATPIDVKTLPYYNPSWKFTKSGGTITVQTDLYSDDESRGFGQAVCNLTRFSGHSNDDVVVLAANGDIVAHRFAESFTSNGTCERG